jgi:hypothetical protein
MEYQICAKNRLGQGLLRRRQWLPPGIGQSLLFWREYCFFIIPLRSGPSASVNPFFNLSPYLSIFGAFLPKRSIMYLLTINLYELGQFLRIVLWIFLPMVILSMLITTWLHYRRKEREQGGLLLAVEGFGRLPDGEPETIRQEATLSTGSADSTATATADSTVTADSTHPTDPPAREEWNEGNENIYRGILWMKEKYEQYRDMADRRYEQLREELGRSEQRYQDLMLVLEESKRRSLEVVAKPKEDILLTDMSAGEGEILPSGQGGSSAESALSAEASLPADAATGTDRELASKQGIIDELEIQLRVERLKVEELVIKLQNNSQLLLNIYQELDKSFSDMPVSAAMADSAVMAGSAAVPVPAAAAAPIPAVTQP